ncbi:MAG TPA: ABC transporter ATP-binding protein [Egibacteraceae bacterium]|nr:ABC transporter ATP-binding protein [Egibacteraceae bacterium]
MASRNTHWQLFAEMLRPRRRALVGLGLIVTAASLLPLAGPQLLRAFIDRAVAGAALTTLLGIAGAYVALGVAAQVVTVGSAYVATRMAWTATNDLRERAAAHALSLDLAFHGATPPGTLVERIDGDATSITKMFTDVVIKVVMGLLTLVGAVVLVALEDWRVGAAMGVFVAAAIAVVVALRNRAIPATTEERAAYAGVVGLVAEQIDGAEDLRALGAGEFAVSRHEVASGAHARALRRAWRAAADIWTATTGAFALGSILMLVAGWALYRRDAITVGTVFLLFQYVQVLRRPIETIAEQLEEVQRAGAGATRIRRLLDKVPAIAFAPRARLPRGPLPVRFDNVRFAYPDDGRIVVDGVNLDISAGSVVGLVGHTGSGKTTLARLALRLVDPTGGAVVVGGVDLRDVGAADLRRHVAIVTQDVQLFDASVRDNVTLFGASPVDDATLSDVLDQLGLGGWLAGLPDGLDTELGGGVGLSAGQAQLLGVARAFLRDPGLVVLDEASSRTDPVTAELVEAALDRLLTGRTAIVIAHRLRSVDRADRVVVLDHGRVVEDGSPAALRNDPTSRYRRLLALEMQGVSS